MKRCTSCKADKAVDDFHKNRSRPDGLAAACKPCARSFMRAWSKTPRGAASQRRAKQKFRRGPEAKARDLARSRRWSVKQRQFDKNLRHAFGIDSEDWARMFNNQGGRCATCGYTLRFDASTQVDHCHRTKKVRGLLCALCNRALGHAKDDPARLRALADYVERHR